MRGKILFIMMFNSINALLELKPSEYTECTRDETLSCSCPSMNDCEIKEIKPTMYLEDLFGSRALSWLTSSSDRTSLEYLKDHKYFKSNSFKIELFEDTFKNRIDIIPTLLKLLNKIPENIMIKGGIIYTKGKSLISGISVKNLSTYNKDAIKPPHVVKENKTIKVPTCVNKKNRSRDDIPDRIYVTSDTALLDYFRVTDYTSLEYAVEDNDMNCFLHSNTHNEKDKYNYIRNMTGEEFKMERKEEEKFSGAHFELYFSYICRSSIDVHTYNPFSVSVSRIPVYISYRFTVGSYLKRKHGHQITGLTYLVTQKPIDNKIFPE
ncbi:uncharacterized protein LOC142330108 isoform X2 [Lycorma delicatula]|uniref:uncharacterized protein LOC142330108 isoform X2 n=1 Tax=Lycorma delicatula TaxID=130591 RepID=UPI003F511014